MTRLKSRTQNCNRPDALNRLTQAESFVEVVELVLADDTSTAKDLVGFAKRLVARARTAVEA